MISPLMTHTPFWQCIAAGLQTQPQYAGESLHFCQKSVNPNVFLAENMLCHMGLSENRVYSQL